MAKDSDGHKKYLTEDAVKQLLKVNDVIFICRYMPKGKKGTLKIGKHGEGSVDCRSLNVMVRLPS